MTKRNQPMTDQKSDLIDNAIEGLDDDMLTSVSGGCTSKCGPTTWLYSCVAPGDPCP
ncbi:MAG: hypothetical protein Tsb002_27950 [Wenzhouxiangellaceae bacterium]